MESENEKQSYRVLQIAKILKRNDFLHDMAPQKLRIILEELGPTYIKLGQIMSMRPDLIPNDYCEELIYLRSEVSSMPYSQVEKIIQEEFGIKSSRQIFISIETKPLGSASIAQVHRAVLKDGTSVVIKVQRPGIRIKMQNDVEILKKAVVLLKLKPDLGNPLDYKTILEELWLMAQQEMDFLIEASHLDEFKRLNSEVLYIDCPKAEKSLTTSRILVMEYIDGVPISGTQELLDLGYDLNEIAVKLAESYSKQILDDGFFHADPHPGNISVKDGKIIWLDFGMMGRLSVREKELLTMAVSAIQREDVSQLKNVVLSMGVFRKKINHPELYNDIDSLINKYAAMDFSSMNLGTIIMEIVNVAVRHQIGMPQGITMLSRGLITIEGVLAKTDPELNFAMVASIHMLGKTRDWQKEFKGLCLTAVAFLKKGIDIPLYITDILKMTVKGQTKINLEITGSEEPLRKIDQMIDKLNTAIICSALLIGSSLICTTNMEFKMLGIPVLGGIGFFLAIILGTWLVVRILKSE
ncbi:AarF/UbiB family protein [Acetobacterium wieringae]|uniref:AarF/UbiB family protein n=2 Tax=Acetobacterium TaxID=33951 RepID=A0ABY6HHG9_9FIRM|nr:AarF/UbiB family protein [Acetobacterium wieringae]UYO63981.1 AarF/UbiB family protein [Acetobacterium wieringae]